MTDDGAGQKFREILPSPRPASNLLSIAPALVENRPADALSKNHDGRRYAGVLFLVIQLGPVRPPRSRVRRK